MALQKYLQPQGHYMQFIKKKKKKTGQNVKGDTVLITPASVVILHYSFFFMDPSEAELNHEVSGESCTDWSDWFVTGERSVWQRGIILLSQTADGAARV